MPKRPDGVKFKLRFLLQFLMFFTAVYSLFSCVLMFFAVCYSFFYSFLQLFLQFFSVMNRKVRDWKEIVANKEHGIAMNGQRFENQTHVLSFHLSFC